MSTPWPAPDPRPAGTAAPAFGTAYVLPVAAGRSRAQDAFAAALAAVVTVLTGAPVGLMWAAYAPRTDVVVVAGEARLVQPGSNAFIAADGWFLVAGLLAGAVGGLLAWRLARQHGPAVVVGLAVGALLAAYVAQVVGEQVGRAELEAAVRAGEAGPLELTLQLRAHEVLLGWPVGAMLSWLGASLLRER